MNTQILVSADNKDNAISVCEGFKSISEDNELIYKKTKANYNLTDYSVANDTITMSVDECQNLISLPARELLSEYKTIENVNTQESEVPPELQKGIMCIGDSVYKGQKTKAYLSDDREYKFLTLVICGATRAGKTTLISNLSKNAVDNGETTIIFDFCGNCELSKEISGVIANNKVLTIDCSDFNTLQGLGYNEVIPNSNNPFEVYRCAKTKTTQLMNGKIFRSCKCYHILRKWEH